MRKRKTASRTTGNHHVHERRLPVVLGTESWLRTNFGFDIWFILGESKCWVAKPLHTGNTIHHGLNPLGSMPRCAAHLFWYTAWGAPIPSQKAPTSSWFHDRGHGHDLFPPGPWPAKRVARVSKSHGSTCPPNSTHRDSYLQAELRTHVWGSNEYMSSLNASLYVRRIHHFHPFCSGRGFGFKDSSEGGRQQRDYSRPFRFNSKKYIKSEKSVKDFQSPFRLCMRLAHPSTCRTLNHVYGVSEERSPHPQVLILQSLIPLFHGFFPFFPAFGKRFASSTNKVSKGILSGKMTYLDYKAIQYKEGKALYEHIIFSCGAAVGPERHVSFQFCSRLFICFLLGRFSTSVSKALPNGHKSKIESGRVAERCCLWWSSDPSTPAACPWRWIWYSSCGHSSTCPLLPLLQTTIARRMLNELWWFVQSLREGWESLLVSSDQLCHVYPELYDNFMF